MTKKEIKTVCEEHVFSSIYEKYSKDLFTYLYFKFGNQIEINDKIQKPALLLSLNFLRSILTLKFDHHLIGSKII